MRSEKEQGRPFAPTEFHPDQVETSTGGDIEFTRDIIRDFLDDSARKIVSIRHLLEADEAIGLSRAAHSVKGAAAALGCYRVVETALAIETRAREKGLRGCPELVSELEEALRLAGEELRRYYLSS